MNYQYNGEWRDLADKNRVAVYSYVNGEWRLFDFGMRTKTDKYLQQGKIVRDWVQSMKLGDKLS